MSQLTHFDESGSSRMVDVGDKPITSRVAVASGQVSMQHATWHLIRDRKTTKGDVREVARLAGIMAAKQTASLIPLCHPLPLDSVEIEFIEPNEADAMQVTLGIRATVRVTARTGVEMEALTAVSMAALTVYDMCKAVDRAMVLGQICLQEKSGGKSGPYKRDPGQV
jgi:cyclic pyranopterin phosphate synthase